LLPFVIGGILANAYQYQEKTETIEEEIELAKMYPFKSALSRAGISSLSPESRWKKLTARAVSVFTFNPYNFDSTDEKDLFKYLRDVLDKDEVVVDVYFTGGATDPTHNDFILSITAQRIKGLPATSQTS